MKTKDSIYRISGFNKETKYTDIVNVMAKSASQAMELMSATHKRMFVISDNKSMPIAASAPHKKGVE